MVSARCSVDMVVARTLAVAHTLTVAHTLAVARTFAVAHTSAADHTFAVAHTLVAVHTGHTSVVVPPIVDYTAEPDNLQSVGHWS